MTTASAPRATAARPQAAPLDRWQAEARRHLDLMGYGPGAVELVAGTNDPGNPEKIALLVWTKATYGQGDHTREWVESERLGDLVRRSTRLAARWGNVYVSVGTVARVENPYKPGKLRYDRTAQQPRRCIVADDVTDLDRLPLPPTWAIETSPGNFQVGYTAEELVSPRDAVRLAEGLALVMRCDPSGSDATQLVRLAGTLNTKRKCDGRAGNPAEGVEPEGWRVRLRAEGPRYPVATLARALLPGGMADLGRQGADKPSLSDRVHAVETPAALAALEAFGAALMASSRYQRFFTRRPQLAALALGQRITLPTPYGLRDSGSEQVAVLVSNLVTTGRRDDAGTLVPGLGAPPLEEIRAVALFWRKVLRPDKDAAAYLADVDGLLLPAPDGYRPAGYAPEATTHIPGAKAAAPRELAPAVHRGPGRPAGARAAQVERLGDLLAARVGERVTRPQLAALLAGEETPVGPRAVACYLATLRRSEGWTVELRAMGRGGLLVQKCDRNCPAESVIVASESVIAPVAPAHHSAEAAPDAPQVVHTPPDLPPCPAPAAALDLEALARDLVEEYGAAWARAKRAARLSYGIGGRGDGERVEALRVAYDAAAEARKAEQKQETVERQAARKAAEWEAKRRAARDADGEQLLLNARRWKAKLVTAELKRPGSGYARLCDAEFDIWHKEARRRGISLLRSFAEGYPVCPLDRRELAAPLPPGAPPAARKEARRAQRDRRVAAAGMLAEQERRQIARAANRRPPVEALRLDLGSVFDDVRDLPADGPRTEVQHGEGVWYKPQAPAAPERARGVCPPQHEAPPPATPGPWVERKPGLVERLAVLGAGKLVNCAD